MTTISFPDFKYRSGLSNLISYFLTCSSERLLIKGYEPKERPDDRFYHAMKQISEMGRRVDELAMLVRKGSALDSEQLEAEVKRWHKFQADVERVYLRPDQNVRRWQ